MIFGRYRRHKAFYIGLAAGLLVLAATLLLVPDQAVVWSANAFYIAYLAVSLFFFPRASAAFLKSHADEEDAPVWIIFVVTAGVIAASVISLFLLLGAQGQEDAFRLIITAVSVPLGWFTIHAMVAHHYAYEYYEVPQDRSGAKKDKKAIVGGLDFPTGDEPDGGSFLYFSYVIGMTAQVADVSVSSREMQRIVLLHGIFSFFFNTVILAATVNVAVTLGGS